MELIERTAASEAIPYHAPALRLSFQVLVVIALASLFFGVYERHAHPSSLLAESNKHAKQASFFSKFVPVEKNGTWMLQNSQFTQHILTLVDYYETKQRNLLECCSDSVLTVEKESNLQRPQLHSEGRMADQLRSALETWVFNDKSEGRALPSGRVKMSFNSGDKIELSKERHLGSFANSASGGNNTVFNFQDVAHWRANFSLPQPRPWGQRKTIPVWRGTGWGPGPELLLRIESEFEHNVLEKNMSIADAGSIFFAACLDTSKNGKGEERHQRLKLVHYSKEHKEFLDAQLMSGRGIPDEYWKHNKSFGLYRLLPFDPIPESVYYTNYTTHVIMGGIGAAFRTRRILGQQIAVMIQDYPYEEWYFHLMVPFVDYIPLRQDLTNLKERLIWIRDNPEKVRQIALNGKKFYDKYLTFEAMGEFYYELIFRLMLCCASDKN